MKKLIVPTLLLLSMGAMAQNVRYEEELFQLQAQKELEKSLVMPAVQTKVLNKKIERLEMLHKVKMSDLRSIRVEAQSDLLDKNSNFSQKINSAAIMMKTLQGLDENNLINAVKEVLILAEDSHPEFNENKMSLSKSSQNEQIFYAIAVTVHETSYGVAGESLLDRIESALEKEQENAPLDEIDLILLNRRNVIVDLLKARINALSLMSLQSYLGSKSNLNKILDLTIRKSIELKFSKEENKYAVRALDGAIQNKKFLMFLNEDVKLDNKIETIFGKVKTSNKDLKKNIEIILE